MRAGFPARVLIAIAICSPTAFGGPRAPGASHEITTITGAILQAEGPAAAKELSSLSAAQLSRDDRNFRTCALSRLLSATGAELAS